MTEKKKPKNIIQFLIEDTKEDIRIIKKIIKGDIEPKFSIEDFKEISFMDILKENWIWFLIIILAFFCGYFFASQQYSNACNEFIFKEGLVKPIGNSVLNASKFIVNYTIPIS